MKRQFVRIQPPGAGKNSQEESAERSSAEKQETAPTPKVPMQHAVGPIPDTRWNNAPPLPTNVMSGNSRNPQTDAQPRIVDQETVIQQAVSRPITGPIFNRGAQQGYALEQMPTSPASSGIWSYASPLVQQSPVTQSGAPSLRIRWIVLLPCSQLLCQAFIRRTRRYYLICLDKRRARKEARSGVSPCGHAS